MIKRIIKKSILEAAPYEKWNQFVDLVITEDYENLTCVQKIPHLCLWYHSEVNNGGHLQYFCNKAGEHLYETIQALDKIEAFKQREILIKLVNLYNRLQLEDINNSKDFINKVLIGNDYKFTDENIENIFNEYIIYYDKMYHNCEPSMDDLLQKYLDKHEEHFIEVIED